MTVPGIFCILEEGGNLRKFLKAIFASESHSMNLTAAYLLSAFILAVSIFFIGAVQRSKEDLRADLKSEYQHNLDIARDESYQDGYSDAELDHEDDWSDGYSEGYSDGYDDGYQSGHDIGYDDGYDEGLCDSSEDFPNNPSANYQLAPNPDGTISVLDKRKAYTVFITAAGSKYHIRTCSEISGCDVTKTTLGEAETAGFSPCSICIPSSFYD